MKANGMQVWLIAKQELLGSFASKGGVFISGVFILTWIWLLFSPIQFAAEAMSNPDQGSLMVAALGWLGLESLYNWSLPELAVYWAVALYSFPLFSLLMSADQMISERQRGGLRFLTLRCARGEIFFGRFLGHMVVQMCFLLATLAITYFLLVMNNASLWLDGLLILPLLLLNLMLVISPCVALMSLLSVVMNSVRIAILVAIIIFVLASILINALAFDFSFISFLNYGVPGVQISQMAKLLPNNALLLSWIPILQSICFLVLGYGLFKRQAI